MRMSKGVIIFAVLIIVFSLLSLRQLFPIQHASIVLIIAFAVTILSIISGVALFYGKNWARVFIIVISVFVFLINASAVVLSVIPVRAHAASSASMHNIYYGMQEGVAESFQEQVSMLASSISKDNKEVESIISLTLKVILGIFACFNLGVIYFFTRPAVKAQFNK